MGYASTTKIGWTDRTGIISESKKALGLKDTFLNTANVGRYYQ